MVTEMIAELCIVEPDLALPKKHCFCDRYSGGSQAPGEKCGDAQIVEELEMRLNVLKDARGIRASVAAFIGIMSAGSAVMAGGLTENDVLAGMARDAVQPSLDKAVIDSRELVGATRDLCSRKDDQSMKEARLKWGDAYLAWRTAQVAMFKGKEYRAEQLVDNWPANEVILNGAMNSKELLHLLANQDVRGFSASEYLLFAPADVAEATTESHCGHLQSIVDEIASQATANQRRWQQDAAAFVSAGDGKPYLVPGDALSLAFARMLNVTERMLRDRLCAPSGFFEGTSKPELLESWRSDTTRKSLKATIDGLRQVLIGDGAHGITALVATKDGLVSTKNPELAQEIGNQLSDVDKRLAQLDEGVLLYKKLQKDDQLLHPLYKSIERLQDLIVEASLVLEVDVRGPGESQMQ